jgi:hypothetical protein
VAAIVPRRPADVEYAFLYLSHAGNIFAKRANRSRCTQFSQPAQRKKPRIAMQGPDCHRGRILAVCCLVGLVIIARKNKYNGEVSLRDVKLGPRIAMRGFGRRADFGSWG